MRDSIQPPRWATRLLTWYCKPALLEDLQGDLNEYFDRNIKTRGIRKARIIYCIDVIKFFRFYTIRKPEVINLFINWIMLYSYIKTSSRSLVRNKLFSTINIVGLAISMAVGLLLISVLMDLFSYDKFHVNHDRIYRVVSRYQYLDHKDDDFMATTSLKASKVIKENFTGVEDLVMLRRGFEGDLKSGDKTIPLRGYWSGESIFQVFSFALIEGNQSTALKEPFTVVLTEQSALKLFGTSHALGKTVTLNDDKNYTVTGIIKDIPQFSHIKFDMLGSFSTYETLQAKNFNDDMKWDNIWNQWTYILFPEHADLKSLQASLNALSLKEDRSVKNTHIELALQPLDNIMIGASMGNQIGPTMGSSLLWIFSGLSFVVILSACFNYNNLSIARSLKRSREVGIRKVIGAVKSNVVTQFVVEAVIIALLSLLFALLLFVGIKPHFLSMEPELQKLFVLNLSPLLLVCFLGFAFFIGIVAGLFPAMFFARMNTIQVLKNSSSISLFRKITIRKALIVFQYCISIMLITGTIIIYKQYKHFVHYDLGFNTENILNIRLQGNKAELLRKELDALPEVTNISQSSMITGVGNYWGTQVKNPNDPLDSAFVYYNTVDENYLPLHKHHLIAGRNFKMRPDSATESEVIVNETALKRFNIAEQNPAKALDAVLVVDGKPLQIIGVIKDFEYGRANNNTSKEVLFRYSNHNANYMNVKIQSTDLFVTYDKIRGVWKKLDMVHPLEAKFYDAEIEDVFSGLEASIKLIGTISFLAICIASIGLLGMVIFTTETRLKEVSIRKVLGASEGRLLFLLGKGFFVLLAIAAGISLPITYLFFENILLPNIGNAAPINFTDMTIGVIAVMIIALIMIGSQTLKVAKTNPADVLKME